MLERGGRPQIHHSIYTGEGCNWDVPQMAFLCSHNLSASIRGKRREEEKIFRGILYGM